MDMDGRHRDGNESDDGGRQQIKKWETQLDQQQETPDTRHQTRTAQAGRLE